MNYKRLLLMLSIFAQMNADNLEIFDKQLLSFMTAFVASTYTVDYDANSISFADTQEKDLQHTVLFEQAARLFERACNLADQPLRSFIVLDQESRICTVLHFKQHLQNKDLYASIDEIRTQQAVLMKSRDYLICHDKKVPPAVVAMLEDLISLEALCNRTARTTAQSEDDVLRDINNEIVSYRKRIIEAFRAQEFSDLGSSSMSTYRSRCQASKVAWSQLGDAQPSTRKERQQTRQQHRLQRIQESRNEYHAP